MFAQLSIIYRKRWMSSECRGGRNITTRPQETRHLPIATQTAANLFLELVNVSFIVGSFWERRNEVLWYVCAPSKCVHARFTGTIGYDLTGDT